MRTGTRRRMLVVLSAIFLFLFSCASTPRKETELGNAEAYYNRGLAYGEKGKYDQAISDFTKALELNPGDTRAYDRRGFAYGKKGQYEQAISDFTKALEINPKFADAYYNRGVAYGKKSQYEQAISDYTRALEINPKFAEAYYNRGVAYGRKGQIDRAISDYTKALEIDPKLAERRRLDKNNNGQARLRPLIIDSSELSRVNTGCYLHSISCPLLPREPDNLVRRA